MTDNAANDLDALDFDNESVGTTRPTSSVTVNSAEETDVPNDLESLLERINMLVNEQNEKEPDQNGTVASVAAPQSVAKIPDTSSDQPIPAAVANYGNGSQLESTKGNHWKPLEPKSLHEAGLSESQIEHLALRSLSARGELSGRDLTEQHAIAFRLMEPILAELKRAQLIGFRGSAPMNDYVYQLTDKGRERARKLSEQCSYFGAAPVQLSDYVASVAEQSLTKQHPTRVDLEHAFSDLLINRRMLRRLGPAVNSGRGLFLFGQPGNGKTSIAERVTKAFGDCVWIPRCIGIEGEIMRVFDPGLHEEVPMEGPTGPLQKEHIDKRWVRIRRPTIVVGGELTMDALEVNASGGTNISEAPIQLKSNCGTLVIDDFGRQRMTTDELLNRWIVPLEKRHDFLQLVSGKKIQVPFDQLIIFSTNLEPKDLVDDAFLRRIPYKIEVEDPSEEEFRELFRIMAPIVDVDYSEEVVDYLIKTHYYPTKRPFRCCQPRDLLLQIRNYCHYLTAPPTMSHEYIDYAVENYFAIM